MALWQFDLQLMPTPIVDDAPDCINSAITDDGLDTTGWWLANQPEDAIAEVIATSFPPLDSWCADMLRWGNEKGVLIEAFIENGQVEGVGIRINVRNIDRASIADLIQLATKLDCHFYVMETQQIVPPDVDALLPHLAKSTAVEFARDPIGFFERLAREDSTEQGDERKWP